MPTALLPAAGFAGIIAVGGIITCFPAVAEATTAATVALAVAGFALGWPLTGREFSWWPVAAAAGVFFVFGAPVIFSGEATFLGYIKLDDTSTWLAFTDHVLTYGHSTAGLAPSSYEATVQINLSAGYPLGAFIPLGIGHELTGSDPAWLFQPYLALMAAMTALVFYELARPVVKYARIRAAVVFIAAQPALLVGYAFWGGIKEVATVLLAAILAASAVWLAKPGKERSIRSTVPVPIAAGAALIGVMGLGGAPWIAGLGFGVLVLMGAQLLRSRESLGPFALRGLAVAAGIAAIGLPTVFVAGSVFSPDQGPLTSGREMGNLIESLSLAQYAGPWPVGDFRLRPESGFLTALLVGATVLAAIAGAWAGFARRAWGLLLVAGGTGLGSLVVWLVGSPWIQGKALATGAASFLLLAMVGIAALFTEPQLFSRGKRESSGGRPIMLARLVAVFLLVVPAGVLVSNVLAYDEAWIAPRGHLTELEQIGEDFAGQGPALMTEYQPYGVRHFLREIDAEGASELRRRQIPRRDGRDTGKGAWSDTDELVLSPDLEGLLTYRTLVLRKNPRQSRPPEPYRLVYSGDFYEVWQRPETYDPSQLIAHLPLGSGLDRGGVAPCAKVASLAAQAGPGGRIAAAPAPLVAGSTTTAVPDGWFSDPATGSVTPTSDGTADGEITVPTAGEWQVWIGGSARGEVSVTIGGVEAGSASGELNNNAQFIELDEVTLGAGTQPVEITYTQRGLPHPGTGAYPLSLGPVMLTPAGYQDTVTSLPASQYRQFCGQRLDWVAALR
jgi:hypothetical protein